MKMYRLMGILLLLENTPIMTAKSLAEHFEVSVRTIYRDLDILSQAGFSIVTESGHGGGISLMNANRIQLKSMDENELLKLVQKVIVKENDDEISENIALKIRGQLPENEKRTFDKLKESTIIDSTTWNGVESRVDDKLAIVQKNILHMKKMMIDYDSHSSQTVDRIIHPLGLAKKASHWYLVAFCELRHDYRVFNLYRISDIRTIEETYPPHPGFQLERFWHASTSQFQKGGLTVSKPLRKLYEVEVQGAESSLQKLAGFDIVALDQQTVTFDMISESVAFLQLMPLADQVRVISPDSLRSRLVKMSKKIIENQSF